jgi:hypothetical protein
LKSVGQLQLPVGRKSLAEVIQEWHKLQAPWQSPAMQQVGFGIEYEYANAHVQLMLEWIFVLFLKICDLNLIIITFAGLF